MDSGLRARALRAIERREFPGCVIGVVRQNGELAAFPFGRFTYDSEAPAVAERTVFDLASITKSIPTASLALALIGEGKLSLDAKVTKYIPELANDYGATIGDLLRYRVVGPRGRRMSALPFNTFEEIRTYVFERGFEGPPRIGAYTNLPAFLLGIILERISGAMLPALAHRYFFEPLGMADTTFFPHAIDRCAPTEVFEGQELRGIVHDESARVFALARRAVGHAGLFSTAPDLLKFLEAMLREKFTDILAGALDGLGWEVAEAWMGDRRGPKTFGKTGFTGTSILCDLERGIGLVILSNRTYPRRPADNSAINAFRKDVADLVLG